MLEGMKTPAAMIQAVQDGLVQQERLHTEDPARFYRYRWLVDGEYATNLQAKALDAAFEADKITVSWPGTGIGKQPVTPR